MAATAKQLPKLFIYDHCPYCARSRTLLGLKKVDHELVFLANHDEATPIGLVGSKQAPILQLPDGKAFPESLDIVRYTDEHYGGPVLLKEASGRDDLKQWNATLGPNMFRLVFPRYVKAPFAEFAQKASRDYFQVKKEKTYGPFEDLVAQTPALAAAVNESLLELEKILHSDKLVNANGVSYDDITTFASLRSLTIIKDIKWPAKVRNYAEYYSEEGDVPLLTGMAQF